MLTRQMLVCCGFPKALPTNATRATNAGALRVSEGSSYLFSGHHAKQSWLTRQMLLTRQMQEAVGFLTAHHIYFLVTTLNKVGSPDKRYSRDKWRRAVGFRTLSRQMHVGFRIRSPAVYHLIFVLS